MRLSFAAMTCVLLVCPSMVAAQATAASASDRASHALLNMQAAADRLVAATGTAPAGDTSAAASAAAAAAAQSRRVQLAVNHVNTLWIAALRRGPVPISAAYATLLENDARTIDSVAAGGDAAALADVLDDLAAKAGPPGGEGVGGRGGRGGSSTGFLTSVEVTVVVRRNDGAPANGLLVRMNPRRYGITQRPLVPFNSASSPTTDAVPPGNFIVWLESADGHVVLSQTARIGLHGPAEQLVLTVP